MSDRPSHPHDPGPETGGELATPLAAQLDPAPSTDLATDLEAGPVALPITDTLDLHSFPPREVPALVHDWIEEAHAAGFRRLRIVHGKGIGVQRQTVRSILGRDPRVTGFGDAGEGGGGWGATWVELR